MGMDFRPKRGERTPPIMEDLKQIANEANRTFITVIQFKSGKQILGHFNIHVGDLLVVGGVIRLYDVKDGGMIAFNADAVEYVTQVEIKEEEPEE